MTRYRYSCSKAQHRLFFIASAWWPTYSRCHLRLINTIYSTEIHDYHQGAGYSYFYDAEGRIQVYTPRCHIASLRLHVTSDADHSALLFALRSISRMTCTSWLIAIRLRIFYGWTQNTARSHIISCQIINYMAPVRRLTINPTNIHRMSLHSVPLQLACRNDNTSSLHIRKPKPKSIVTVQRVQRTRWKRPNTGCLSLCYLVVMNVALILQQWFWFMLNTLLRFPAFCGRAPWGGVQIMFRTQWSQNRMS